MITSAGLRTICENPLTKAQNTILWHLLRTMPLGGNRVSHIELAHRLSINHIRVGQTMRYLCKIGFITRSPRDGINYHYTVNPVLIKIL